MLSTQKSAYSSGTFRNLICQWKSFFRFVRKYSIHSWPVSEHEVALYAQFLSYSFKSAKAVRNYLSGLKTLHVLTKVKSPDLKDPEIRITIKALEKKMAREIKRAQPLTPEILMDLLTFLDLNEHADFVFWVILLIGFFGMLRKSNLMPDKLKDFDPIKHLTRGHVTFQEGLAILKVTWAKNLQCRERLLEIPLFPIEGSPLCPVTVLRALLANKGKRKDPLFGHNGKVLFTYSRFQRKFRKLLRKAGYNEKAFSSHSMRRGSATFTFWCRVPDTLIQVHGDWASDAFKRYLQFPLEVRALVSLRMRDSILKAKF